MKITTAAVKMPRTVFDMKKSFRSNQTPKPPPTIRAPRHENEIPPEFSPDSPVYSPEIPGDNIEELDRERVFEQLRTAFFDSVLIEGFSLELEFKIHSNARHFLTKSKFSQILKILESQKEFTYTGTQETSDWYSRSNPSANIRKTCTETNCTFMEKRKILNSDIDETRISLSSERDIEENSVRDIGYDIFRKKKRHSFEFQCWKFDFTEIQTNDPAYRDSDDDIFEIELELILTSEWLLYYTIDHLVHWGFDIFGHFVVQNLH